MSKEARRAAERINRDKCPHWIPASGLAKCCESCIAAIIDQECPVEKLRVVKSAASDIDKWIGSKAIRTMCSEPPAAADFSRLAFKLRAALAEKEPADADWPSQACGAKYT